MTAATTKNKASASASEPEATPEPVVQAAPVVQPAPELPDHQVQTVEPVKHKTAAEAIVAVMRDMGSIGKDRQNEMQKYSFRGIDDVYNELHKHMAKHGLFTIPRLLDERSEERPSRSGILIYRILKLEFDFTSESGDKITAGPFIGEGMDSGDKASNKAHAVAHKYALLQVFAIPTSDPKDPENDTQNLTGPNQAQPNQARANPPANRQQERPNQKPPTTGANTSGGPTRTKHRMIPTMVEDKPGRDGKKPYFVVHFGESWASTFSKTIAEAARAAVADERPCQIEVEKFGKFNNLITLEAES